MMVYLGGRWRGAFRPRLHDAPQRVSSAQEQDSAGRAAVALVVLILVMIATHG